MLADAPTLPKSIRRHSGDDAPPASAGPLLSYTFDFDWTAASAAAGDDAGDEVATDVDRVYVVPKFCGGRDRGPASRVEAFMAAAQVHGRLLHAPPSAVLPHAWVSCFMQVFGDADPVAHDTVLLTRLARSVDAAQWAVGTELRKLRREASAAGAAPPSAEPQLLVSAPPSRMTEGDEWTGVGLKLANTPLMLRTGGVVVRVSCATGGLVPVPEEVRLGAGQTTGSFNVIAQGAGDHALQFRLSGVNGPDVAVPAPLSVEVTGRDQAVHSGATDALSLLLDHDPAPPDPLLDGRAGGGGHAFTRGVRRLLEAASAESCRGLCRTMAKRGLLRLLQAVMRAMPDEALAAVSGDALFHEFPVWGQHTLHISLILGDYALAERVLAVGSIDGVHANAAAAAALLAGQTAAGLRFVRAHPGIGVDGPLPGGDTAVCIATRHGDCDTLRELIAAGADVNHVTPSGDTPLLIAIKHFPAGSATSPVRRRLVEALAVSDRLLWDGSTGRRNAAAAGLLAAASRPRELKLLLTAGCPPAGACRPPPLFSAIDTAGVRSCTLPADEEAQQADVLPPLKDLSEARRQCTRALAHACVDQRVPALDGAGPGGVTPLSRAVQLRDYNLFLPLLESGANPAVRDDDGRNALHYAVLPRCCREEPVESPESHALQPPPPQSPAQGLQPPPPQSPAQSAAASPQQSPVLQSALSVRSEVTDSGDERTAVALQLLGSAKAGRTDASDRWGQTPLHLACGAGRAGSGTCMPSLTRALLTQHAFRPAVVDSAGRTPLHCALRRAAREPAATREAILTDARVCAEYVIMALPADGPGAQTLEQRDRDGNTALILAIRLGASDVVEAMCRRFGAVDTSEWNFVGDSSEARFTPLLCALTFGGDPLTAADRTTAEAMAKSVLSCSRCDMGGSKRHPCFTPLNVAASRRYVKATRKMLARGAIPQADKLGHTPLTALCRPAPYDTPTEGLGLSRDVELATREELCRSLMDLPALDVNAVVPAGTDAEAHLHPLNVVQLACKTGCPEIARLVSSCSRLMWTWSRETQQPADHPLCLLLNNADVPVVDKLAVFNALSFRCSEELASSAAVLFHVVRGCVDSGLYEPLGDLLRNGRMVAGTLLPGGISLLQAALTSTFTADKLPRRQGVCEELLRAGVDVNATGKVAGVGTAVQCAAKLQMWRLLPSVCREERKIVAHLTTRAEPKPAIQLLLEAEQSDSVEVCAAISTLLATGTAIEGQLPPDCDLEDMDDEAAANVDAGTRDAVALLCCRRGLAQAIASLDAARLMPPTPPTKDGPFLAHAACLATVWEAGEGALADEDDGAEAGGLGAAAVMRALRDTGWLQHAVDVADSSGRTPLLHALWHGRLECCDVLLEAGAGFHTLSRDSESACHCVVMSPHYETEQDRVAALAALEKRSASLPFPNAFYNGETVLHMAARLGMAQVVKRLLDSPSINPNMLSPATQQPPLYSAVLSGSPETAKSRAAVIHLLLRHPHINPAVSKTGTPFVHALLQGYPDGPGSRPQREILSSLLRPRRSGEQHWAAALLGRRDESGATVIAAAVAALVDAGEDEDPARAGDASAVLEQLLAHPRLPAGVASEAANSRDTPLHMLAMHPFLQNGAHAAAALLARGADATATDSAGLTALQRLLYTLREVSPSRLGSAWAGDRPVQALLKTLCDARGFSPTWIDGGGRTLLHLSMGIPCGPLAAVAAVRILAQYRLHYGSSDVNAADMSGASPVVTLLQGPQQPEEKDRILLELLQHAEFDPYLKGSDGNVMHYILRRRSVDLLAQCVASAGLKRHLEDKLLWHDQDMTGRTILHVALLRGTAAEPPDTGLALLGVLKRYARCWALGLADKAGVTPALLAARLRLWRALELLLAAHEEQQAEAAARDDDEHAGAHAVLNPAAVVSPCGASVLHTVLSADDLTPTEALYWTAKLGPPLKSRYGDVTRLLDRSGSTVLHIAAERVLVDACRYLTAEQVCSALAANADEGRWTPLHAAAEGESAAHELCALAMLECPEQSSEPLYDPADADGVTPLMLAAQRGHLRLLRRLLALRADPGLCDLAGRCPLLHALEAKREECARELMKSSHMEWFQGAKDRALALAIQRCRSAAMVTTLLEAGCSAAAGDPPGLVLALRLPRADARLHDDGDGGGGGGGDGGGDDDGVPEDEWVAIVSALVSNCDAVQHGAPAAGAWAGGRLGTRLRPELAIPGLLSLPCTPHRDVMKSFFAGQPAGALAEWAEQVVLPPPSAVDKEFNAFFTEGFRKYWALPRGFAAGAAPPSAEELAASMRVLENPASAAGGGAVHDRARIESLRSVVEHAGEALMRSSAQLRNRIAGALMPPALAASHAGALRGVSFRSGGRSAELPPFSALPPVAALMMCICDTLTKQTLMADAVADAAGCGSVAASESRGVNRELQQVVHAAVVFGCEGFMGDIEGTAPELLKACCNSPQGDGLELAAAELGGATTVAAVLGARGRHGTQLGISVCEAFCRRPEPERTWGVFKALLNHRAPLTPAALMYCIEEGRIAEINCVGDTILHIIAINSQEHLLSGLLKQVPQLSELGVCPQARNVFGKRALDYTDDISMASAIRDMQRPQRIREAAAVLRGSTPVPVPLDLAAVRRAGSPHSDSSGSPRPRSPMSGRSVRSAMLTSRPATACSHRGAPSELPSRAATPAFELQTPRSVRGPAVSVATSGHWATRRPLAFEEQGVVQYEQPMAGHLPRRGKRRRDVRSVRQPPVGAVRAALAAAAKAAAAVRQPAPPPQRKRQPRPKRSSARRAQRTDAWPDTPNDIAGWSRPAAAWPDSPMAPGSPARPDVNPAPPQYYSVRGAARPTAGGWCGADLTAKMLAARPTAAGTGTAVARQRRR